MNLSKIFWNLIRNPRPIKHQYQKRNNDCGQTCLEMLGYPGNEMFPEGTIILEKLFEIDGVRRVPLKQAPWAYRTPHLVNIYWPVSWNRTHTFYGYHAIIHYNDEIYCPSKGVHKLERFVELFQLTATAQFRIPFNDKV